MKDKSYIINVREEFKYKEVTKLVTVLEVVKP